MADFRKYAVTVAGLACMLGAAGAASAQSFSGFRCSASATPFDMRAEGITEQAGDVVLTCTGGTRTPAGSAIPQVNITVSLNTNVTSRLTNGSAFATEALLLLNEPASGTDSFCPAASSTGQNLCAMTGTGDGGGSTTAAGTTNTTTYSPFALPAPRYNGVQGAYLGSTVGTTNQMTFFGVPIDPPGAPNSGVTTTPTLTIRITNIRSNASQLGAPTGFSTSSVFETVSTSAGFPIDQNVQTVGIVRRGLIVGAIGSATTIASSGSIGTPTVGSSFNINGSGTFRTFQQCVSSVLSATGVVPFAETINFSEGFATATKLRYPNTNAGTGLTLGSATSVLLATPGQVLNSESQFVPNGLQSFDPSQVVGTGSYGTRIRIAFANVAAGVTLYLPTTIGSNQGTETLTLTTSDTGGGFSAVSASSASNLPTVNGVSGFGTSFAFASFTPTSGAIVAVYEVSSQLAAAPTTVDSFSVPVLATFTANPTANTPALGGTTVTVDFSPLSTVVTAASSPIPRFVQTNTAQAGFSIAPCSTVLLFPFLTNLAGFDTGLAIAATATDPFGTLAQSGTCRLNFCGTAAPAQITTPSVASGTVYTNLLSTLAPGFQGYMIAQCAFQYGHGFAFITDGFGGPGRGLSQGYLALIIPDPSANAGSRSPSNVDTAPVSSGEGLTN